MPELPEVEILVRHLRPKLRGQRVLAAKILRPKILRSTPEGDLRRLVCGSVFNGLVRRGKYLLFGLSHPARKKPLLLVGHLGMTGRFFLAAAGTPLPKHTAAVFDLGSGLLVFEDARCFGRLTLDCSAIDKLGPEPLGREFTTAAFARALRRSRQAIKVKLLDQSVVAGVGNIYASEALFRAAIAPTLPACRLNHAEIARLRQAVREVLREAIRCGSTIPLNHSAAGKRDELFYFGTVPGAAGQYQERLRVYDREDRPCSACGTQIRRIVQAARSTFFCPRCQARRRAQPRPSRKPARSTNQ